MSTGNASFWEAVKGAAQSLRSAKLRSFLTLLGIILATATLISVMSVISGMDVVVAQNITDLGADGYTVARIMMMQWDPKKFLEMQRRNPQLNQDEFDFLRSRVTLTSQMGLSAERGEHRDHQQLPGGHRPILFGNRRRPAHGGSLHRPRHPGQVFRRRRCAGQDD
jgi:hypothetical protein